MIVKVKYTSGNAENLYSQHSLKYETNGSAGIDIRAVSVLNTNNKEMSLEDKFFILNANSRVMIKAGFCVSFEDGFEIQIRPRSGLAWKHGITVLNSPGTIDSDYRGEIGIILLNTSNSDFEINFGDRIAQMVVNKIEKVKIEILNSLEESERSSGGFGSTGK
jgi:dUTP pyrophosphatase